MWVSRTTFAGIVAVVRVVLLVLSCVACGSPAAPNDGGDGAPSGWACPASWVRYAVGGCAPAWVACTPDGGAAAGACTGIDLSRPLEAPDASPGSGFFVAADGAVSGGWASAIDMPDIDGTETMPTSGVPACPAGWNRGADQSCDPRVRSDCPGGSAVLPGGACTATADTDCPATGAWRDLAAEPGSARVVRVRAGADDATADGSELRPFGSVTAAVSSAGDRGWVLVGRGTFAENVDVTAGVHIVGLCPGATQLRGSDSSPGIRVHGATASLDLRHVSLSNAGLTIEDSAEGTVTSVRVDRALARAIYVTTRGRADLHDVVATSTRPDADGMRARGLQVSRGARVTAERLHVSRSQDFGVLVLDDGTLTLSDSLIEETLAPPDGAGIGLASIMGSTVDARRIVVRQNTGYGVRAHEPGTRLTLTDSWVGGNRPAFDRVGRGVDVYAGSITQVVGTTIADNVDVGVYADGMGTELTLRDSVVRATGTRRDGTFGRGVSIEVGARAVVSHSRVVDSHLEGVVAINPGSTIEVSDSIIARTEPDSSQDSGFGLSAQLGGTVRATRTWVLSSFNAGAIAYGDDARLELTRCRVAGTRTRIRADVGEGLSARQRGRIVARNCRVTDNEGLGVNVDFGGYLEMFDSRIDHQTLRPTGSGGSGIGIGLGGHATIQRCLMDANRSAGVFVISPGSEATIDQCTIADTLSTGDGRAGRGIELGPGTTLRLSRSRILRVRDVGLLVDGAGATARLEDVEVGTVAPVSARFGHGLAAQRGAAIDGLRVFVHDCSEIGVSALHDDARVTFRDLVVQRVSPSDRGFGLGLGLFGRASLEGDRIAIEDVAGGGIVATYTVRNGVLAQSGASVSVRDVFVRRVRPSDVRFELEPDTARRAPPVAYGLHTSRDARGAAERIVFDSGGYGFFSSGGPLTLSAVVVTRQLDAAGAVSQAAAASPLRVSAEHFVDNAVNDVVYNAQLPEAVALTPPTPVCSTPDCL